MAILLAIAAIVVASGFGRTVLARLVVLDESGFLRFAYTGAIGLGIAAYSVLLAGWFGQLSFWPVTMVWLAMLGVGHRGIVANCRDLTAFIRHIFAEFQRVSVRNTNSLVAVLGGIVLILIASSAVLICFKPPAGLEWDAISYHLADPAQFLVSHRVFSIPTEHHSNFPLLMEMLFTVGLLYNGYALANMMHLITAVLTVAAIFACCRRLAGSTGAWIAVLLFVSTPVVLWESSVAYVEMGLGLFTTLAVLAVVRALVSPGQSADQQNQWLILCALCTGFGLGVKYLALVPFGLVFLFIAFRSRSVRQVITFTVVALAIGSPWYVKNAVLMHNPVYPYIYKLFPGSANWSAGRAAGYEAEQSRFGTPHSLKRPGEAASDLMQVPWDLVTLPLAKPGGYSNEGEFTFLTLIGGLVFAFNALVLLRQRVNREVAALLILGATQIAAWFFVAQVSRYLVSVLPILVITGAFGVVGICEDLKNSKSGFSHTAMQIAAVLAGILLAAQVMILGWVTLIAPSHSNVVSLPQIAEMIQSQDGVDSYLLRRLDTFAVTEWINKNTPKTAGVLLYDDTRGYYIDRRYMWANEEHSGFIPYGKFRDGQDLTDWMVRNNYRYAMFDMNWAPQRNADPDFAKRLKGNEGAAFQKWYATATLQPLGFAGYRWRGLVADAYRRGLWTDLGVAQNGVILFHIGPDNSVSVAPSFHSTGAVR